MSSISRTARGPAPDRLPNHPDRRGRDLRASPSPARCCSVTLAPSSTKETCRWRRTGRGAVARRHLLAELWARTDSSNCSSGGDREHRGGPAGAERRAPGSGSEQLSICCARRARSPGTELAARSCSRRRPGARVAEVDHGPAGGGGADRRRADDRRRRGRAAAARWAGQSGAARSGGELRRSGDPADRGSRAALGADAGPFVAASIAPRYGLGRAVVDAACDTLVGPGHADRWLVRRPDRPAMPTSAGSTATARCSP